MNRVVRRSFIVALVVAVACVAVAAQQQQRDAGVVNSPARRVAPAAISGTQRTPADVDENFELNIAERRITERDFYASTAIETDVGASSPHGLSLRVGVGVGASEIDVLLRNVQGRVRFRGSLAALRRILDARREPTATPPPPAVVP